MAFTDQPYLPLFVDDWMNNNKLKLCSPGAHGLLISIMCIMHKSDTYGKILLKQKFKQNPSECLNFASQLSKMVAFNSDEVFSFLTELLDEKVICIEGDFLISKRMVKDHDISVSRSLSGSKGGKKTQKKNKKFASTFAKANPQANTGIENGIGIGIVNNFENIKVWIEELKTTDHIFQQMIYSSGIKMSPEQLVSGLDAYQALVAEYPAKENIKDIGRFRYVALEHLKKYNLPSKNKNGKQQITAEELDRAAAERYDR